MRKHVSTPFNPNVAHVYYLAGFIESWGRGIEKICNACAADGVYPPEYTVNPGDIMVKFTAPEDRIIRSSSVPSDGINEGINEGINNLPAAAKAVYLALHEDSSLTAKRLISKTSLSRASVERAIKTLKEKGFIERSGSKKTGSWIILK